MFDRHICLLVYQLRVYYKAYSDKTETVPLGKFYRIWSHNWGGGFSSMVSCQWEIGKKPKRYKTSMWVMLLLLVMYKTHENWSEEKWVRSSFIYANLSMIWTYLLILGHFTLVKFIISMRSANVCTLSVVIREEGIDSLSSSQHKRWQLERVALALIWIILFVIREEGIW